MFSTFVLTNTAQLFLTISHDLNDFYIFGLSTVYRKVFFKLTRQNEQNTVLNLIYFIDKGFQHIKHETLDNGVRDNFLSNKRFIIVKVYLPG